MTVSYSVLLAAIVVASGVYLFRKRYWSDFVVFAVLVAAGAALWWSVWQERPFNPLHLIGKTIDAVGALVR